MVRLAKEKMKVLKRNQVIIFVIALMLVSAGYLNYTSIHGEETTPTSGSSETNTMVDVAGIGDAQLVSSNVTTNTIQNTIQNTVQNAMQNTTSEITNTEIENTVKNETVDTWGKVTDSSQYFNSSRLSRETMYSQMIESYQKILENQTISADQKAIAQTEIKNINNTKNAIMICENLIKTKGFEDLIIFVNDTSISVILKAKELSQEQIAQVQNIVTRELKADINQIHISSKE